MKDSVTGHASDARRRVSAFPDAAMRSNIQAALMGAGSGMAGMDRISRGFPGGTAMGGGVIVSGAAGFASGNAGGILVPVFCWA